MPTPKIVSTPVLFIFSMLVLTAGGCPSDSGSVVDGQIVTESGVNCWDTNGNGVSDASEDVNGDGAFDAGDCQGADGASGANGASGPAGIDGTPGANGQDGATGADGGAGPAGAAGADGASGAQGPPGPLDTTRPTAATSLRISGNPDGPPGYSLRWNFAGTAVAISHFNIYESGAGITESNASSALWAAAPASNRSATVYLFPDTGVRRIRVAAVSYTGVVGTLSPELEIDTTSRVAFVSDVDGNTAYDIYSASPAAPETADNLTGLTMTAGVFFPACSPTGGQIAYVADALTDNLYELFVANLDGSGSPLRLNPNLVNGGGVTSFRWSPDGKSIAYTAEQETDNLREMYVVSAAGGTAVKVSGPPIATANIDQFAWSPDGSQLAFTSDRTTNGCMELYVTSATGGTPARINGPIGATQIIDSIAWSPDGRFVAYRMQESVTIHRLLMAPAAGGSVTDLSGATQGGVDFYFKWSPDGKRVAFVTTYDPSDIRELYSVAVETGERTRLSGTIVANGDVLDCAWSPDGAQVLFAADRETDGIVEHYLSPAGGGGIRKISGALAGGGSMIPGAAWSPDGTRIAFRGEGDSDGVNELYSVYVATGTRTKISGSLVPNGDVQSFAWSPDGTRLLFMAQRDSLSLEVYCANGAGGEIVRINPELLGGINASNVSWSPLSN